MSQWFEQHGIDVNTPLIVAVSGGPDSVALLHILHCAGFQNMVVAHLDHNLRFEGKEDVKLVQSLAEKYGCAFELKEVQVQKMADDEKGNVEAVGRRERYRFFRDLKQKYQAQYIVAAHHGDDQVETILMNLVRGCGLDGISGMQELDGDIWRPMLRSTKQQLIDYCTEHNLQYAVDHTNEIIEYRRNFLRHNVIPKLKELNPNLVETFTKNARLFQLASDHFTERAAQFLSEQTLGQGRYHLSSFVALSEKEQSFVLRQIFQDTHGHKRNLVQEHLEQLLKVIRTNSSGKQKEFGPGKVLVREHDWFEVKDV